VAAYLLIVTSFVKNATADFKYAAAVFCDATVADAGKDEGIHGNDEARGVKAEKTCV
jgi:hypothetical protein